MRGFLLDIHLSGTLSVYQRKKIEDIPGVTIVDGSPQRILSPLHAGDIVKAELNNMGGIEGQNYRVYTDTTLRLGRMIDTPIPPEAITLLKKAEDGFDAAAVLFPYQREGLLFALERETALIKLPCGSGKTPIGAAWLVALPGRGLVVGVPGTVDQWTRELLQWTRLQPHEILPLEGETAYTAVPSPVNPRPARWLALRAPAEEARWALVKRRGVLDTGVVDILCSAREVVPGQIPPDQRPGLKALVSLGLIEERIVDPPPYRRFRVLDLRGNVIGYYDYEDMPPYSELFFQERVMLEEMARAEPLPPDHKPTEKERARERDRIKASTILGLSLRQDPAEIAGRLGIDSEKVKMLGAAHAARRFVHLQHDNAVIPPDVRIAITTWSVLLSWQKVLMRWQPEAVVWDEISYAKEHSRWKAEASPVGGMAFTRKANLSSAADAVGSRALRALGLDATPDPDRTRDLWSPLDLLLPRQFGRYRDFANRHCEGHQGRYNYDDDGASNVPELRQRLRWIVFQRSKEETHKDLPPLRVQHAYLPAADADQVRASTAEWRAAKSGGATSLLELRLALAGEAKRPYLLRRIEEVWTLGRWKVVVLLGRVAGVDRLAAEVTALAHRLKLDGARVWGLHGGTPKSERRLALDTYKDVQGPCAFIGTLDAWGRAHDGLQYTDLALLGSLPWNHGMLTQVFGRFHRHTLGRTPFRPIIECVFLRDSVDEEVRSIIVGKASTSEVLFEDPDMTHLREDLEQKEDLGTRLDTQAAKLLAAYSLRRARDAGVDSDCWEDD